MKFVDEEITQVLLKFLDKKASEAEKEIEEKGILSEDKAIPLILRTQFNHIAHIEKGLDKIEERLEKIEKRIGRIFTLLGIGFGIITALIVIFQFIG